MKISNKQQQEVNFLSKTFNVSPSEQEIERYFKWVSEGKNRGTYGALQNNRDENCLFIAKRKWDITLKMYLEDLVWARKGSHRDIVFRHELIRDFNDPYAMKCINKLFDNFELNENTI
jgi:hypothetical protein